MKKKMIIASVVCVTGLSGIVAWGVMEAGPAQWIVKKECALMMDGKCLGEKETKIFNPKWVEWVKGR